MSLKKNILANYISQFYVTLIGILLVPLYIQYMGAEAYGLVGFFAMLQAWFNLLDLGLSPTIARESARYHGGAMSALEYRRLFRALSVIFCAIALFGGGILWLLSDAVANRWLKVETLPRQDVVLAVQIMAISVALRWMSGLYRGVVSGAERLVWLSGYSSLTATLRFVGVLGSMWLWGYTPRVFFIHQLIVTALEFSGLFLMIKRLLPNRKEINFSIGWSFRPVKPLLKFALTIAFTSSVWVLVTQTDKLVLSNILPLADYGYFTVAVMVASGIGIMSGPISTATMPRMARLQAEGQEQQLIATYRQATKLVIMATTPITLVLVFYSSQVLWAWTGNQDLVTKTTPVLTLFASGYGILAVSAFPYYLQYAKGDLKLHLIGNAFFACLLIPSVIWAAIHHGMVGAGWAWMISNAVYLLAWAPLVHRRFAPGLHYVWLLNDIFRPILLTTLSALIGSLYIKWSSNRIIRIIELITAGLILFTISYIMNKRVKS